MDVDRALDFLGFVGARHQAWRARQQGLSQPWTAEPVVATRKFTNVFRVLDPGSQFVITDLLADDPDPEVFLMRCFLYRHTNLPSAWRAGFLEFGEYPTPATLDYWGEFWRDYRHDGHRVFSGAYMIYPQSSTPGTDKIESVIRLTSRLWAARNLWAAFEAAPDQNYRFVALRTNKGVADFMSMQILTDFGYSTEFREDEFIVPGPGARKGALALGMKGEEAVEWAYRSIRSMPDPPTVQGRLPSRMDAQNCLCEFSKWVRFSEKPVPLKPYTPAHPGPQIEPVLPEHWD